MAVEETVKEILQDVLDVKPEEIKPDAKLADAYGVDSTEMVEINVGIKKQLSLDMENNTFPKKDSNSQFDSFKDKKTN